MKSKLLLHHGSYIICQDFRCLSVCIELASHDLREGGSAGRCGAVVASQVSLSIYVSKIVLCTEYYMGMLTYFRGFDFK